MKINSFVNVRLASLKKSPARTLLPAVFLVVGLALTAVLLLRARATDLQIAGVSGTTNRQANFILTASPDEFWELQSNPGLSNGGWRTEKLVRGGDPAAFQAPATSNQMFFRA